jgi:integrase
LKSVFNYAKSIDLLEVNPCDKVKRIKLPERQPLFLSKDEFKVLCKNIYNAGYNDFLDLVILATYTGMRRGELINLSWKTNLFRKTINNS